MCKLIALSETVNKVRQKSILTIFRLTHCMAASALSPSLSVCLSVCLSPLCIYFYTDRHDFILFFSFFFCLYIRICVLYFFFFFFFGYTPLASYLIRISCFEYVWICLLLLYFLFFVIVHVYYQQDSISPSWARAGFKKTLSLIHYPCEIKFIYSFIHSFSLSLSLSLLNLKYNIHVFEQPKIANVCLFRYRSSFSALFRSKF